MDLRWASFVGLKAPRSLQTQNAELDQLGVEGELGVVGEELRDGAAGLGIGGGLVEDFLGGSGNACGGGEGNLCHGESTIDLGEGHSRMGLDLRGGQARSAELRAESH